MTVMGKAARAKLFNHGRGRKLSFLVTLVQKGQVASLAEAVDEAVSRYVEAKIGVDWPKQRRNT